VLNIFYSLTKIFLINLFVTGPPKKVHFIIYVQKYEQGLK